MEKEFIPYEQALALKELGFDEPCMAQLNDSNGFDGFGGNYRNSYFTYPDQIAVPLYQQAFKWFRERYNLHCNIDPWGYCIFDDNGTEKTGFENYEQSQLECIEELIKIVK